MHVSSRMRGQSAIGRSKQRSCRAWAHFPPCWSSYNTRKAIAHARSGSVTICQIERAPEQGASWTTQGAISAYTGFNDTAGANIGSQLASLLLSAAILCTCSTGPAEALEQQEKQDNSNYRSSSSRHQVLVGSTSPDASIGELASLFAGEPDEKDPIEPFTMYGSSSKKYVIEQLDGNKIVARKRGFTVRACISTIPQSQESPEFQGLPTGEKVYAAGDPTCVQAEGAEMKPACVSSCGGACEAAFEAYAAEYKQRMGYVLEEEFKQRMLKSCRRSCAYECTKGGKVYDFVVPSRR